MSVPAAVEEKFSAASPWIAAEFAKVLEDVAPEKTYIQTLSPLKTAE
jgi:hypothetical protein